VTIGVPSSGFAIHTSANSTTDGDSIATQPTREARAGPQPGRKCRP